MAITRYITKNVFDKLYKGKVVVIYGPRQVGKTTLVKAIIKQQEPHKKCFYLNCDEPDIRVNLTNKTSTELKNIVGDSELVVIDEAQRVENIGLALKILVDTFPIIQFVVTGSSSLELSNKIKEPLTGRTYEFVLYPLSVLELSELHSHIELDRMLEKFLVTGLYPEPFSKPQESGELIKAIAKNYLYKDALEYQDIRSSGVVERLMQMLALQIGSEVSYSELSNSLGIDVKTVEKYIDIMEKAFVIHKLTPFSRNLRSELNRKRKIYFWDCGIRNALINNFNPLDLRSDRGELWENFIVSQMKIASAYTGKDANSYFWRTWGGSEIDYVEDSAGKLSAYEIKWQAKKPRVPRPWLQNYPKSSFALIERTNWQDKLRDNSATNL